jgi:hypothetical protein
MDLYLINSENGLKPIDEASEENLRKLKFGVVQKFTAKKARNYELHKKYFKLISVSWDFLKPEQRTFFNENKEGFRKTCEMTAGHCEKVYHLGLKSWIDTPLSISFDNMDEFEFRELYEAVRRVIFDGFLRHVSFSEFEKELMRF